jgi:hypothetical protein
VTVIVNNQRDGHTIWLLAIEDLQDRSRDVLMLLLFP